MIIGHNFHTDKIWTDEQPLTIGLTSIRKYGGFYIARYEAGILENATEIFRNSDGAIYDETTRKNRNTLEIVKKYIPVSKKNMPVWNYVDKTSTKILAEKMVNNDM